MTAVQNWNNNKSKARSVYPLSPLTFGRYRRHEVRTRHSYILFPATSRPRAPRFPVPRPRLPRTLTPWGNLPRMDGRARRNRQCSRGVASGGVGSEQAAPTRSNQEGLPRFATVTQGCASPQTSRKCWGYMGRTRCFSRCSISHVISRSRISPGGVRPPGPPLAVLLLTSHRLQAHQSLFGAPPASRPRTAWAGCRRIVGVGEGEGPFVSRTGVGGGEKGTALIALSPTWDPGVFLGPSCQSYPNFVSVADFRTNAYTACHDELH